MAALALCRRPAGRDDRVAAQILMGTLNAILNGDLDHAGGPQRLRRPGRAHAELVLRSSLPASSRLPPSSASLSGSPGPKRHPEGRIPRIHDVSGRPSKIRRDLVQLLVLCGPRYVVLRNVMYRSAVGQDLRSSPRHGRSLTAGDVENVA